DRTRARLAGHALTHAGAGIPAATHRHAAKRTVLGVMDGDRDGSRPDVPGGRGYTIEITHVHTRRVHGDADGAGVVARVVVHELMRRNQRVAADRHPRRSPA